MRAVDRLDQITQKLLAFRDERDWEQFHTPKNLALALSVEVAELNELFLWKNEGDRVDESRVAEELADVLAYVIYLANRYDLDLPTIMERKIELNALKYPVGESRGNATKYNARQ